MTSAGSPTDKPPIAFPSRCMEAINSADCFLSSGYTPPEQWERMFGNDHNAGLFRQSE